MSQRAEDSLPGAARAEAPPDGRSRAHAPPELAVVVPTLNERDNVEPLLERLTVVLGGLEW
jgi:hypothetical protein